MINLNFVSRRIAVGGGTLDEKAVTGLLAIGITHVVNCIDGDDSLFTTRMSYLPNPTPDNGQRKEAEWFRRSITFCNQALVMPSNKVYIHSTHGLNRAPATALAVMMAYGLKLEEAEDMIRHARPDVELRYKADAVLAMSILGYQ